MENQRRNLLKTFVDEYEENVYRVKFETFRNGKFDVGFFSLGDETVLFGHIDASESRRYALSFVFDARNRPERTASVVLRLRTIRPFLRDFSTFTRQINSPRIFPLPFSTLFR